MLSLFPQILFLTPFAALLLRVALAVFFALAAWQHMNRRDALTRLFSIFEIAIAVALFLGAWTQAVALLGLLVLVAHFALPKARLYPISTMLFAVVILLSLVVTGAGAFAFDLPL